MIFSKNRSRGSATLEYIMVTIFGLILTASAMRMVNKIYQSKLQEVTKNMNIDIDHEELNLDDLF